MMSPNSLDEETKTKIFDCIAKNNVLELKPLLSEFQGDIYDDHGMTPLQHAAYKGNKELVQLFLDQGADVNSSKHEHGYTALHFGVLSANHEVCQLLLNAGAKIHARNSVGKIPTEMAAFVGNHLCAAVINNFIPRSEIDYYTVARGLETEPKLPLTLAAPFHKFASMVNMNPVAVALHLQPHLVNSLEPVSKVLALMREREMKRKHANELRAFKFHYMSSVVTEVTKCKQLSDPVEAFVRKVLRNQRGPEYLERFMKDCVREFPYRECVVFRHLVHSIAQRDPDPIGQFCRMICPLIFCEEDKDNLCATCGTDSALKKCSKCKNVKYCDRTCQRLHWFVHKKECERTPTTTTTSVATTTKVNKEIEA